MSKHKKNKDGNYEPDTPPEKCFTAYIIKGNRQVVSRMVTASKRFRVEEDTYIIRDSAIFQKMIDKKFQGVAYYREGNPNPYNFKETNEGLTAVELDRMFAEDFYHIITNLTTSNRMLYILIITLINLGLLIAFDIGGSINVFF